MGAGRHERGQSLHLTGRGYNDQKESHLQIFLASGGVEILDAPATLTGERLTNQVFR